MKKLDFQNYKVKQNTAPSKLAKWQSYALEVCQQFQITGEYRSMIFRYAKRNLCFLQGKVENVKEKFGTNLEDKGNYLISLFRKND